MKREEGENQVRKGRWKDGRKKTTRKKGGNSNEVINMLT